MNRLAYAVLLLALIPACKRTQTTSANHAGSQNASAKGADAKGVARMPATNPSAGANGVADPSLADLDYVKFGMPATDRPWTGEDYSAASNALAKACRVDDALPRWHSRKSGDLFNRLVSEKNLEAIQSKSLSASQRISLGVEFMPPAKAVLLLYIARSGTAPLDREVVEMLGFQLHVMARIVENMDDAVASWDPRDPTYVTRVQGIEQARSGLAEVVFGTLSVLGDLNRISPASRARLCELLQKTLPTLQPQLPEGPWKELPLRLAPLADAETDAGVKGSIIMLRDKLAALPPPRPLHLAVVPTTAPSVPAKDWTTQLSKSGGFRVLLPGTGIEMAVDAPKSGTTPTHLQMLATRTPTGIKFVAARIDPSDNPEAMEPRLLSGKAPVGELELKSQVLMAGHNGYQFIRGGNPPRAAVRFALAGGHAYMLVVEAENPSFRIPPEDIGRFFNSFQIIDGPALDASIAP